MKKKLFIFFAIFAQILVLVFMAAERESIIFWGRIVRLRTAPVDPRDPFRGDYISLNYEISNIPVSMLSSEILSKAEKGKDIIVYVSLIEKPDGVFTAKSCSLKKPEDGSVFIRGRIDRKNGFVAQQRFVRVRYGIEKFFLEQGKGIRIEERAGRGDQIHIPLEMSVALNRKGVAVLKDIQWSPLGIGLEVVEEASRENFNSAAPEAKQEDDSSFSETRRRRSVKLKLTLKNCSEKEIAVVDLPDYGSFSVDNSEGSLKLLQFSHKPEVPEFISDDYVKVLKPEQSIEFFFDFAEPRWFVNSDGGPKEIGVVNPWEAMFRIRYNPPLPEKCAHLKNAELIWHGELISRTFSPIGYID